MKFTTKSTVFGLAITVAAAPIDSDKRQLSSLSLPSISLPAGGLSTGLPSLPSISLPFSLPSFSLPAGGLSTGLPSIGEVESFLKGLEDRIETLSLPSGIFPTGSAIPSGLNLFPFPSLDPASGGVQSGSGAFPTALPLPSGASFPTALSGKGPHPLASGSADSGASSGEEGTELPTSTLKKRVPFGTFSGLGSLSTGFSLGSLTGSSSSDPLAAIESELSSFDPLSSLGSSSSSSSDPLSSLLSDFKKRQLGSLSSFGSLTTGLSSSSGSGILSELSASLPTGLSSLGSLSSSSSDSSLGDLGSLLGTRDSKLRTSTSIPTPELTFAAPGTTTSASASTAIDDAASSSTSGGAYPNAADSSYTAGDSATDVSSDTGCREMTFIFARGTTEPGTLGFIVGPQLAKDLHTSLGSNKVSIQGVDYPASIEGNAELGAAGGPTMAKLAKEALAACPNTKLVLSGYSQGAMVVHNAISEQGLDGSDVAAIVVFGDPFNGEAFKDVDSSKVLEVCGSSDVVCIAGKSDETGSHLSYGKDAEQAATFVIKAAGL